MILDDGKMGLVQVASNLRRSKNTLHISFIQIWSYESPMQSVCRVNWQSTNKYTASHINENDIEFINLINLALIYFHIHCIVRISLTFSVLSLSFLFSDYKRVNVREKLLRPILNQKPIVLLKLHRKVVRLLYLSTVLIYGIMMFEFCNKRLCFPLKQH